MTTPKEKCCENCDGNALFKNFHNHGSWCEKPCKKSLTEPYCSCLCHSSAPKETTHIFDATEHDKWCAVCGQPIDSPIHSPSHPPAPKDYSHHSHRHTWEDNPKALRCDLCDLLPPNVKSTEEILEEKMKDPEFKEAYEKEEVKFDPKEKHCWDCIDLVRSGNFKSISARCKNTNCDCHSPVPQQESTTERVRRIQDEMGIGKRNFPGVVIDDVPAPQQEGWKEKFATIYKEWAKEPGSLDFESVELLNEKYISLISTLIKEAEERGKQKTLQEVRELIEEYFKGLVAIPAPELTKKSLLSRLSQLEEKI